MSSTETFLNIREISKLVDVSAPETQTSLSSGDCDFLSTIDPELWKVSGKKGARLLTNWMRRYSRLYLIKSRDPDRQYRSMNLFDLALTMLLFWPGNSGLSYNFIKQF